MKTVVAEFDHAERETRRKDRWVFSEGGVSGAVWIDKGKEVPEKLEIFLKGGAYEGS